MEEQEKEAVKFLPFLRSQKQSTQAKVDQSYVPSSCSNPGCFHLLGGLRELGDESTTVQPLMMVGLLVVAAVNRPACITSIYLSYTVRMSNSSYSSFGSRILQTALSTSIQWLCAASLSLSLTQLCEKLIFEFGISDLLPPQTWSLIRRWPFTVIQLNHLFRATESLPNYWPHILQWQ